MNSSLLLTTFTGAQAGPTLMGVDVIWAGTMLAAVGVFAVLFAIYGALTVRNPMTKRVKALNDRREQLKAGITASTAKRRAKLVRKNQHADKMRTFLGKLQVLQEGQIKEVQQKLAQAGIRSKDLAVAVIFGRLVLPIVFGGLAALPDLRLGHVARLDALQTFGCNDGGVGARLQGTRPVRPEQAHQAYRRDPQRPSRRARSAW